MTAKSTADHDPVYLLNSRRLRKRVFTMTTSHREADRDCRGAIRPTRLVLRRASHRGGDGTSPRWHEIASRSQRIGVGLGDRAHGRRSRPRGEGRARRPGPHRRMRRSLRRRRPPRMSRASTLVKRCRARSAVRCRSMLLSSVRSRSMFRSSVLLQVGVPVERLLQVASVGARRLVVWQLRRRGTGTARSARSACWVRAPARAACASALRADALLSASTAHARPGTALGTPATPLAWPSARPASPPGSARSGVRERLAAPDSPRTARSAAAVLSPLRLSRIVLSTSAQATPRTMTTSAAQAQRRHLSCSVRSTLSRLFPGSSTSSDARATSSADSGATSSSGGSGSACRSQSPSLTPPRSDCGHVDVAPSGSRFRTAALIRESLEWSPDVGRGTSPNRDEPCGPASRRRATAGLGETDQPTVRPIWAMCAPPRHGDNRDTATEGDLISW